MFLNNNINNIKDWDKYVIKLGFIRKEYKGKILHDLKVVLGTYKFYERIITNSLNLL